MPTIEVRKSKARYRFFIGLMRKKGKLKGLSPIIPNSPPTQTFIKVFTLLFSLVLVSLNIPIYEKSNRFELVLR